MRLRLRAPVLALESEELEAPEKLHRTVQVWVVPSPMVAVMTALPFLVPRETRPELSTVATSGSLLLQVMVPVVPSGWKVTTSCTGSG